MYLGFGIMVPANTPADTPVVQELPLTVGVIHRIEIDFPAGCQGMVSLVLERFGTQLWPLAPSDAFRGEAYTIPIDERYALDSEPLSITAKAWSPGTSYPHTITVRVGILPAEVFQPESALTAGLSKLLQLIGVK